MGGIESIGIEKINVFPTTATMNLETLAKERQFDLNYLKNELMVHERGVNPPWEDTVTMAVNAAKPMLTDEDRQEIGLVIFATETGLDYEKSLSSWVHRYLELPADCRHFELKSACYGGTLALKMCLSWLLSGLNGSKKKALILTSDHSLISLNKPWEFVNGAGAAALLISKQPDFFALEYDKTGFYTSEYTDVLRPLPWLETGNGKASLYSYLEGLLHSYQNYAEQITECDFEHYFKYNIYHVPFAGISYRAHKQLLQLDNTFSKKEILASFEERTLPSLHFPQRIGATYSGSVFIALISLIYNVKAIESLDRVGIFSFGAGFSAEFYSGFFGEKAKQIAQKSKLKEKLDHRYSLSIKEYELFEKLRVEMSKKPGFQPDRSSAKDLYSSHYEGKGMLVYCGSEDYNRSYQWS